MEDRKADLPFTLFCTDQAIDKIAIELLHDWIKSIELVSEGASRGLGGAMG
jgi:hypothetical protein